jgi:hypothetical protein
MMHPEPSSRRLLKGSINRVLTFCCPFRATSFSRLSLRFLFHVQRPLRVLTRRHHCTGPVSLPHYVRSTPSSDRIRHGCDISPRYQVCSPGCRISIKVPYPTWCPSPTSQNIWNFSLARELGYAARTTGEAEKLGLGCSSSNRGGE